MRKVFILSVLIVLATAAACSGTPSDPSKIVVARADDRSLYLADLERYFEFNLLEYGTGEALSPEEADEVKSRLYDSFVEEHLLLAEAEDQGFEASDEEVLVYLGATSGDLEEESEDFTARRQEALRRIKIEKLQEQALFEQPGIEESEVRNYLKSERPRLTPSRRVELRALMLPSVETAERVHRELKRRRITFNEAVVAHEAAPGQGLPMSMDWENLSPEAQQALEGLKPGQVTPPVELHGEIYLLQVESWLQDPAGLEQELVRRSRNELEAQRRMEAYDKLRDRVRKSRKVRMSLKNLPFRYVRPGGE